MEVASGTEYVVSYSTAKGHYAAQSYAWAYSGIAADPLHVAGGFGSDPAGVYDTNGNMPTSSFEQGNYYVDALFESQDASALNAYGQAPLNTATSVPLNTAISATLSKPVTASSVQITLKTQAGASVAGTTNYVDSTRRATFTPASVAGERHKLHGKDRRHRCTRQPRRLGINVVIHHRETRRCAGCLSMQPVPGFDIANHRPD